MDVMLGSVMNNECVCNSSSLFRRNQIGECGGQVVKALDSRARGRVRSSLGSPSCVLEQDTFTSPKVLVIPRKLWLRLDRTEKLFTGTLSKKTKTNQKEPNICLLLNLPKSLMLS